MAKCPKCNEELKYVDAEATTALLNGEKIMSLTFSCPHCQVAISVQVHPGALIDYMKKVGAV